MVSAKSRGKYGITTTRIYEIKFPVKMQLPRTFLQEKEKFKKEEWESKVKPTFVTSVHRSLTNIYIKHTNG